MALYQYDLYLVRTDRPESVLASLRTAGVVREERVEGEVVLEDDVHAFVDEGRLQTEKGTALQVLVLQIADEDTPRFTRNFDARVHWLAKVAAAAGVVVAFMPGGPDAGSDDADLGSFLSTLLDDRRVITAHALVWLSSPSADEGPCTGERPPYRKVSVPGAGCLFALVDVSPDGSFEILEPGPDKSQLMAAWSGALS